MDEPPETISLHNLGTLKSQPVCFSGVCVVNIGSASRCLHNELQTPDVQ